MATWKYSCTVLGVYRQSSFCKKTAFLSGSWCSFSPQNWRQHSMGEQNMKKMRRKKIQATPTGLSVQLVDPSYTLILSSMKWWVRQWKYLKHADDWDLRGCEVDIGCLSIIIIKFAYLRSSNCSKVRMWIRAPRVKLFGVWLTAKHVIGRYVDVQMKNTKARVHFPPFSPEKLPCVFKSETHGIWCPNEFFSKMIGMKRGEMST